MNIGDRIKSRRNELNMTLEEVGNKVGVTRATIQRYENGTISNIPSDKIELISKALDITPAYIMGWDEPQTIEEAPKLTEEEKILIKNYKNSNTRGKKIILDTSKNISKAYPYISRQEMIAYLQDFQIAAYKGSKNLHDLTDQELEEKYYRLKEDFQDDWKRHRPKS